MNRGHSAVGASLVALAMLMALVPVAAADTTISDEPVPVLHRELLRGTWATERLPDLTPASKSVDGNVADWIGQAPGFAGAAFYSSGEYVYRDYLFDAYGASDDRDVDRAQLTGPLAEAVPQAHRLEAVGQADPGGQAGLEDTPLNADEMYGNAGLRDTADLVEVRVAADADAVYVLARTTTMREPTDAAVLVLADTIPGSEERQVGFNSGLRTARGNVAILLAHGAGRAVDLVTGATTQVPVVANPSGWTNAIEAAIPRGLVQAAGGQLRLAVAAGPYDASAGAFDDIPGQSNVANVAFRSNEPVRIFFDRLQAFALHDGVIDDFFAQIDTRALEQGRTERLHPRPGYHERVFVSSEQISSEGGMEGIWQPYGVYLPTGYRTSELHPLQFWMHWRGGKTHSAAGLTPRVFRDMGEARGGVVVAPRGRGTSTWYLGRGHVDFLEVWDDAFEMFSVDPDRVYVAGHSMGGWASWLLSILYPDRFAGAFPVAPPVTQGAWTGVDFPGCHDFRHPDFPEYTPCYVETNNGDARVQHTRRLLDNLRHVPLSIFHGAADELVPVLGVTRQAERLVELQYRHRYYLFPAYEHFTHPIVDEWIEGVRYLDNFRRDPNPARVTYVRDMPFERTVETGPNQSNPVQGLSFDFDSAYWMSELTPADPADGVARFDGRSLALPEPPALVTPEAGGPASPGQAGPYTMTGLAWSNPFGSEPEEPVNAFEVTLEGATAVRLDLGRMAIDPTDRILGTVTTQEALRLRLAGFPRGDYRVAIDTEPADSTLSDGVLEILVPAGVHDIVVLREATSDVVGCGDTVTGTVVLTADLVCEGPGLLVGAPGTVILLDGRSITGSGGSVGISSAPGVPANDVVVRGPGTIRNFQHGVVLEGGRVSLRDLVLARNAGSGALVSGARSVARDVVSRDNGLDGLNLRGPARVDVVGGAAVDNGRNGIVAAARNVLVRDAIVRGNGARGVLQRADGRAVTLRSRFVGNEAHGLHVLSDAALIRDNEAFSNTRLGILARDRPEVEAKNNTARGNNSGRAQCRPGRMCHT